MIALLFVLFIFGLLGGWSIGLTAIFVCIYQFANSLGVNFSFLQLLFIILVIISVPTSLAIVGFFLDDFIFPFGKKTYFTGLALAISCYLLISSDSFIYLIEKILDPASFGSLFTLFLLVINKILLSSTVVALGLISIILCIELPFLFFSKTIKSSFVIPLRSVRSIIFCFLISFSFQAIYDFVSSEVNLDNILLSSETELISGEGEN